jgi:zinc transport system substrate-binding protein
MRQHRHGAVWFCLVVVLLLTITLAVTACQGPSWHDQRIGVVVTLLPQVEFVQAIGGERVKVTAMVPPGADPHTYEMTPGQMVEVSKAKVYVALGSGIEFELVWMGKIIEQNKKMLVVDCASGVQLMQMIEDEHHEAEEGEHHTGNDPHIWLSPRNVKIMAENIYQGLTQIDPEGEMYYTQNRDAYLAKLDNLDRDIREGLTGIKNRRFIVFHPAWGYFAREYGLEQLAIEVSGKEPSARDIANLVKVAKENNIKVVFASPQFNPQSAQVIAKEIGGRVIFIDDLASNYIDNMHLVLGELVQAME